MKLILSILITALTVTSVCAKDDYNYDENMKRWMERQKVKSAKRKAKFEKEWNDPYNKRMRELQKKHYGKVVHGDKQQAALQKDILDSVKESN